MVRVILSLSESYQISVFCIVVVFGSYILKVCHCQGQFLATGAEVHTIGDFNIDTKSFTSSVAQQGSIAKAVTDKIISQGVTQCVKSATRWPQGRQAGMPVTIDHHWTTDPEKLSEIKVAHMGSSDHALLSAVRYARQTKSI